MKKPPVAGDLCLRPEVFPKRIMCVYLLRSKYAFSRS